MRTIESIVSSIVLLSLSLVSCKKQLTSRENISQAIKNKILGLGFSPARIQKIDEGYLIEGDILVSNSDLDSRPQTRLLRIAGNEQYRTFNLLTALPRTLTISLSNQFPFAYGLALDEAIKRYNTENLQIHFQRANTNGDIEILKTPGNFIGAAGLPSASETPARTIKLNPIYIGNGSSSSFINYITTLIAHEIGHCIGFRHTDYMNRSFSCQGRPVNEGTGNAGAINISGTPTGFDSGSWMLACIAINQNRPFNENDKIALRYLY